MIITGNYTLQANPNWKQLQLQEIYLECDTTIAAVNITLPEIASMGGFFNVKIYVSDFANNASVNNINVIVSGSDTIDATASVTINTNGGSAVIAITSPTQWICLESNAGGGGGGGLITVTKAALDALILSNSLVAGSFYRVLGVDVPLYGGTDIIVQAVSSNEISEDGTGFFYNPKYSAYGIYDPYVVVDVTTITGEFTFNETFTSNNGTTGTIFGTCVSGQKAFLLTSNLIGLTSSISITGDISGQTADILIFSVPPYGTNSKVIWGGLVWQNTSNDLGQIVDIYNLSPADWVVIPTPSATDYNYVADAIKYDYINDLITYRCEADADNSVLATIVDNLSASFVTGYTVNAIKAFQWGRQLDLITFTGNNGNKVENSYFECINFNTEQNLFNNITQNSVVYGINSIFGSTFSLNNLKNNGQVFELTLIDNSTFFGNNISDGSYIFALTFQKGGFGDNIFNFSSITGLFFYNSDFRANLLDNSSINGLFCEYSYFNSNNLSYATVNTNSLKNNSSITQNVLIYSQIVNNTLDNTQILYNNLEGGSTINVNTFADTTVYYNKLKSSILTFNITSGGSSIQSNLISLGSNIGSNTSVNSNIDFNILETFSEINGNTFNSVSLTENKLSNSNINANTFDAIDIAKNILSIGSAIANCSKTGSSNAILNNNTLNTFSYIEFVCIDASDITSNSLSNYSFISENIGGQIIILQNNTIVDYSKIQNNNYSGGLVGNNELYSSSYIDANTLNGGVINACVLTSNSNITNNTIGASSSIGSRTTLDSSSILNFTIGANTSLTNYTLQKSTLTGWNLTAVSGLSPTCIFINNQVLSLLVAFPTSGTYIGMLEFANNAAALAGGLAATGLYRVTGTGTVQIVT